MGNEINSKLKFDEHVYAEIYRRIKCIIHNPIQMKTIEISQKKNYLKIICRRLELIILVDDILYVIFALKETRSPIRKIQKALALAIIIKKLQIFFILLTGL